jgi:hypothetical protein
MVPLNLRHSIFSSLGTAAISFDFSSVAICGSTRGNSQVCSKCDFKKNIPLGNSSTVLIY